MAMLSKKCARCGKEFFKDYNRSVRDFLDRAKYCSNTCKVYESKFYKHWEGKKRPELLKTGAKKTMFSRDNPGYCPPERIFRKHGFAGTKFYRVWLSMNQRCSNSKTKQFDDYGGRGITVEWKNFESFHTDMYAQYQRQAKKYGEYNLSIDRIDNNGNYSKNNCRWTTKSVQMRNRRNNHMITFKGKTLCITDWAKELGITYNSLWKRMQKKSFEEIVTCVGYEV